MYCIPDSTEEFPEKPFPFVDSPKKVPVPLRKPLGPVHSHFYLSFLSYFKYSKKVIRK